MTEWGIDTLFNPGKRHMDEEKRRLQSTREEIGDSSGGRRIDLESGTVKISRKGAATSGEDAEAEAADTEAAEAGDQTESAEAAEKSEDGAPETQAPSQH